MLPTLLLIAGRFAEEYQNEKKIKKHLNEPIQIII